MKAFLLAAGKGERMRPLTDHIPKPLLEVKGGKTLLDYQLERLFAAGIEQVIINTAYLGDKIRRYVEASPAYVDKQIIFSEEPHPLETAGALNFAMDILGDQPFLLVNGDVWVDMDYKALVDGIPAMANVRDGGGHLVLVNNPQHNTKGDFKLNDGCLCPLSGALASDQSEKQDHSEVAPVQGMTFSGISVLSPNLIKQYPRCREVFPLREVFDWGMSQGRMSGVCYDGFWLDVGTPERLEFLRSHVV